MEANCKDKEYCQCDECRQSIFQTGTVHFSDCAVHNEPAIPKGECNCEKLRIPLIDAMSLFCCYYPESLKTHLEYKELKSEVGNENK